MKIVYPANCQFCEEDDLKSGKKLGIPKAIFIELNDKGIYSWKCEKNHTNWFFQQEPLFQILFDLGALALSDGYTREAVSSFATSLERFYEFVIKLILLSNDNINEELIVNYWKPLEKKSERQLGAYITLFVYKFYKMPSLPHLEEFRNNVIHKGHIPTEKKALEYGNMVSNLIFDVLFLIKEYFKDDASKIIHKVAKFRNNLIKNDYPSIEKAWYPSEPNLIQVRMINSPEFFKRIDLEEEIMKIRKSPKPVKIGTYIK